jgi:hypothetical protein
LSWLTAFGAVAITVMMAAYALAARSACWVLIFAVACGLVGRWLARGGVALQRGGSHLGRHSRLALARANRYADAPVTRSMRSQPRSSLGAFHLPKEYPSRP